MFWTNYPKSYLMEVYEWFYISPSIKTPLGMKDGQCTIYPTFAKVWHLLGNMDQYLNHMVID